MPASNECVRCGGAMEQGFLMDRRHHRIAEVAKWVEGEPEKSFWLGVQTKGREVFPVTSRRCTRCGWLEMYALPAHQA